MTEIIWRCQIFESVHGSKSLVKTHQHLPCRWLKTQTWIQTELFGFKLEKNLKVRGELFFLNLFSVCPVDGWFTAAAWGGGQSFILLSDLQQQWYNTRTNYPVFISSSVSLSPTLVRCIQVEFSPVVYPVFCAWVLLSVSIFFSCFLLCFSFLLSPLKPHLN